MRKYNKKLVEELEKSVPDLKASIKCSIDWDAIKLNSSQSVNSDASYKNSVQVLNRDEKERQFHSPFKLRVAFGSVACLFVLCLSVILPLSLNSKQNVTSTETQNYILTINVNPTIRLEVNDEDIVTNQYGLNKDGIIFLYNEDFVGKNAEDATKEIIDKLNASGFFKYNNQIKLSVSDSAGNSNENKKNEITSTLGTYIKNVNNRIQLALLGHDELVEIENSYYKNDIKSFEDKLVTKYKQELIEQANQKLKTLRALTTILSIYANNVDSIIENFNFSTYIMDFCTKYKYDIDFKIEKPTYKNIFTLYNELIKEMDELEKAISELKSNTSIDKYSDSIKDLYYIVEDILYAEN